MSRLKARRQRIEQRVTAWAPAYSVRVRILGYKPCTDSPDDPTKTDGERRQRCPILIEEVFEWEARGVCYELTV